MPGHRDRLILRSPRRLTVVPPVPPTPHMSTTIPPRCLVHSTLDTSSNLWVSTTLLIILTKDSGWAPRFSHHQRRRSGFRTVGTRWQRHSLRTTPSGKHFTLTPCSFFSLTNEYPAWLTQTQALCSVMTIITIRPPSLIFPTHRKRLQRWSFIYLFLPLLTFL